MGAHADWQTELYSSGRVLRAAGVMRAESVESPKLAGSKTRDNSDTGKNVAGVHGIAEGILILPMSVRRPELGELSFRLHSTSEWHLDCDRFG